MLRCAALCVLASLVWGFCLPVLARAAEEDAFRPAEERAVLSAVLELEAARAVIAQQTALLAKDQETIAVLQAENGSLRTALMERGAETAALQQALDASDLKAGTAVKLAAAADERSARLEAQLKTAQRWIWIGTGVGFVVGFVAGVVVGAKLQF